VHEPGVGADVDVRRYAKALGRRKLTVLVVVLTMVLAAVALSLVQKRVYSADAQVLVQPGSSRSVFDNGPPATIDPALQIGTEIKVVESKPVQNAVERRLGKVAKVSATRETDTLIIDVRGQAPSARRAAVVANTYASTYIEQRHSQAVRDFEDAVRTLQDKVTDLQRQIDDVDRRLVATPAPSSAVASSLGAQRNALTTQQGTFRQQLDQLQVQASLAGGGAKLIASAITPKGPSQPRILRNVLLALIAGLAFGVSLALVREYMDDSIRTADDVDAVAGGLPLIGAVPVVADWRRDPDAPRLLGSSERTSPAAEAFRSLRTSLQLLNIERQPTVIQFTSPLAGEGKTTTACNLAVALAAAGQRVVVVDFDLRRPRVDATFGLSAGPGFTSVLAGHLPLTEAVRPVATHERLFILAAGPTPPNPSELLAARRTSEVVFALQSTYDMVIIDSPPVLPVTDAVALSAWVDATVIVVAADSTTKRGLAGALRVLRQSETPVVGVVLNQARPEAGYGYGYGYDEPGGNARSGAGGAGAGGVGNGQRTGGVPESPSRPLA
jgi:succinoglycan biosynthesis transport protein ExoP